MEMTTARRAEGFSLIEVMVVMVIVALLAMAALPFTQSWTDGANQSDFRNQVARTVGLAQSMAVRNPNGVSRGAPAVRLALADGQLEVIDAHDGTLISSLSVPDRMSITDNTGATMTCVEWDNRRSLVTDNGCTVSRKIAITMDGQTDLEVELL